MEMCLLKTAMDDPSGFPRASVAKPLECIYKLTCACANPD